MLRDENEIYKKTAKCRFKNSSFNNISKQSQIDNELNQSCLRMSMIYFYFYFYLLCTTYVLMDCGGFLGGTIELFSTVALHSTLAAMVCVCVFVVYR